MRIASQKKASKDKMHQGTLLLEMPSTSRNKKRPVKVEATFWTYYIRQDDDLLIRHPVNGAKLTTTSAPFTAAVELELATHP